MTASSWNRFSRALQTLSYANEHRPFSLLDRCLRETEGRRKNKISFQESAAESGRDRHRSVCLTGLIFAEPRGLHLLLDHHGYLPVFAHITEAPIVVFDRGYNDYESRQGVFFVTRLKDRADSVEKNRESS